MGIDRDGHTRIDQLLILDWVAMGLEDLLLERSDGVFTVGVDLRACWVTTPDWVWSYTPGRPFAVMSLLLSSLWTGANALTPFQRDIMRNHCHTCHVTQTGCPGTRVLIGMR